jgi:hypothetical protein
MEGSLPSRVFPQRRGLSLRRCGPVRPCLRHDFSEGADFGGTCGIRPRWRRRSPISTSISAHGNAGVYGGTRHRLHVAHRRTRRTAFLGAGFGGQA